MMLEGIRVIELGTTITAPLAAVMLADLGADVVKVERPEGDPFRAFRGGKYSPHFIAFNRNKRSIVLDLTTPDGVQRFIGLLATADIFVDNVRPGVLTRLGLDPAMLRERNPRLIHCSITGFGASGPYRARPAFDAVTQALSGISSLLLDPDAPDVTGPTISDNVSGMYAAYAMLGALYERERTGRGRRLEVNMLEASMAFIADTFVNVAQLGIAIDPHTRVAASQSYVFRCADGKLVAVHLSSIEKFWQGLTAALDLPELQDDDRFRTRMDRLRHYIVLRGLLGERFGERPRSEWIERLERADVPYASVNSPAEVLEDPHVRALGVGFSVTHPTEGEVFGIHAPVLCDGERVTPMVPAPTLGQHQNEF